MNIISYTLNLYTTLIKFNEISAFSITVKVSYLVADLDITSSLFYVALFTVILIEYSAPTLNCSFSTKTVFSII